MYYFGNVQVILCVFVCACGVLDVFVVLFW